MKNKLLVFIKLAFILSVSFVLSKFFINNIFLAKSPKIRPDAVNYIATRIKNTLSDSNFFAFINKKNISDKAQAALIESLKKNLKPITKGVKAASQDGASYIEYSNNVEYEIIAYTLSNGKQIKIRYVKGMQSPPKELFE